MFGLGNNSLFSSIPQRAPQEQTIEDHNEWLAREAARPDGVIEYTGKKMPPIISPKPARPGDSSPRAFVGNTLEKLNGVLENYSTERDLLAKDIAKLVEEHRQVLLALEAVSKAISHLETPSSAQMEMRLDEATEEALRLMK